MRTVSNGFQAAAKTGPVPAPRARRETREAPWSAKVEEVQAKVQLVETFLRRLEGGECRSCTDRYMFYSGRVAEKFDLYESSIIIILSQFCFT